MPGPFHRARNYPWRSWEEVPARPPEMFRGRRKFFLEIFAGVAVLTAACLSAGIFCLPPVELDPTGHVEFSQDVHSPALFAKISRWVEEQALGLIHIATPCSSFSTARRDDGGPPPLRSKWHPYGVPGLSPNNRKIAREGNRFAEQTVKIMRMAVREGVEFTVENPATSWLWRLPPMATFRKFHVMWVVALTMCAYGSSAWKPTHIWSSSFVFQSMTADCPGVSDTHHHVVLRGSQWSEKKQRIEYNTKAGQVYPQRFCQAYAQAAGQVKGDH